MAKTPTKPVAVLVADLGGTRAVAEKLQAEPETVRMWAYRNKLPRQHWPELIEAFPGVTMERLIETERAA